MLELSTKKRERLIDLLLLLAVSYFSSLIFSIYIFKTGKAIQYTDINFPVNIYNRLLSLGVLFYILYKQRRSISEFGLSFKMKDIWHSILIIITIFISYMLIGLILRFFFGNIDTSSNNIQFVKTNSFWVILYIFINPIFEELILRGYLITELRFLIENVYLAVFISVFIQSIANLHQGIISVVYLSVTFLILSLYFVKTKRITPVILAHFLFDFIPLILQ